MPAATAPKKAPLSSVRSWMSDATQNRFIAIVLAMLVAVPLLASPADRNMTGFASLTLELFALVLMTMLLWRARFDLSANSVRQFLTTGANAPVLLLVGLIAVSAAFSPFQVFSVQQLLSVGAGALLYFVVGYQFRQSKHLSMLSSVLLFLGGILGFIGLATYQMTSELRAGKTLFGDPQLLASLLVVLLPVVGALAFTDKNQTRARVAQFVAVLMIGALLATQVRIAWLGSFVGLATLAFLAFRPVAGAKREAIATRKHNFVWPVMFAVIAAGFAFAMYSVNSTIADRAATAHNLGNDISLQNRLIEWSAALQMILQKPLTGWGTGMYAVFQSQFTHQGAHLQNNHMVGYMSMWNHAHNFYLELAAELGLPGLVIMVSALVSFLVAGFKRVNTMEAGIRRTLLMGSLAATTGVMVDACASPSWQYGQVAMFLWLMMGIGTSCFRPRAKAVKVEEEATTLRRAALLTRPAAVAMALVVATLLPSIQVASAQGYDPDDNASDGNSTGEDVAIGVGVAAAGVAVISSLIAGGTAAAGAGAAGAAAAGAGAGAATVAADGTIVGGAPGTATAPAGNGGNNQ